MLFQVAAIVLAFPLASTARDHIAGLRWAAPSTNPFASVIVLALALVLWAVGAWTLNTKSSAPSRSLLHTFARSSRAFLIAALLFAVVLAILAEATGEALSPLFLGLHLAFALALLMGARFGWRTLVTAGRNRDLVAARAVERVAGRAEGGARSWTDQTTVAPAREERPRLHAPLDAVRSPGQVASAPEILGGLRRCMDEVAYHPGDPNVLSMTKYVHHPGEVGEAALRGRGALAPVPGTEPRAARWTRAEEGDEVVLEISGVLDAVSLEDVRPAIEALVAEPRSSVSVDLSGLSRIDSAGVGMLVGLFKRRSAARRGVTIRGAKDQPLAVFRLLRLERILAPE